MLPSLHVIGLLLVIAGALNLGVYGLFEINLIAYYCGGSAALATRAVYVLIGLAGLMLAVTTIAVYSDWRAPNFSRR